MSGHGITSKSLTVLLALTTFLASPARSDNAAGRTNPEAKKLCYCGCDAEQGAPMCAHMCELAKYQNRWWATSCRKPKPEASTQNLHPPNAHSKKNNRNQQALLK
jgi:hypothetical protein